MTTWGGGARSRRRLSREVRQPLPQYRPVDRGTGGACRDPQAHASLGDDVEITRSSIETRPGPSEWFTGAVYIDAVAAPSGASRLSASSVHFTPGARTAWHTH